MDGWPYTDIIIINIIIIICTLEPRSRDYIKVNNYRWQSGDINGSSNNNNNSITARSYGDKFGRGQKKTLKAGDRSDYLDLVKNLSFMNNSDIASNMQRASKAEHRFYGEPSDYT